MAGRPGPVLSARAFALLLDLVHGTGLAVLAVLIWLVPDGALAWRGWCTSVLVAASVAAMLRIATDERASWRSPTWWGPAIPYVIYALAWIAAWQAHPSGKGTRELWDQVMFLALAACVARVRRPAWLLAVVLMILCLIGLQVLGPVSVVMATGRAVHFKSLDQWGGYPEIGVLMAMGSMAGLAIALGAGRLTLRAAAAFLSLGLAATTVYMLSRSAILTIMAVTPWLVAVAAWRFRSRPAVVLLAIGLVGAVGVAVSAGPDEWARIAAATNLVGTELDFRSEGWRVASAMIRDHPWLGIGPGRYPLMHPAYSSVADPVHAYNILLHTGAELGLLGLAAYSALWGRLLLRTLRAAAVSLGGVTAFAAHAMLLSFLLRSQSEHFLANVPTSFRMLLVIGVVFGLAEAASTREPRGPSHPARPEIERIA